MTVVRLMIARGYFIHHRWRNSLRKPVVKLPLASDKHAVNMFHWGGATEQLSMWCLVRMASQAPLCVTISLIDPAIIIVWHFVTC